MDELYLAVGASIYGLVEAVKALARRKANGNGSASVDVQVAVLKSELGGLRREQVITHQTAIKAHERIDDLERRVTE